VVSYPQTKFTGLFFCFFLFYFILFIFFLKQNATCTMTRTIFYTYMRTERSAAASEYLTRNLRSLVRCVSATLTSARDKNLIQERPQVFVQRSIYHQKTSLLRCLLVDVITSILIAVRKHIYLPTQLLQVN